MAKNVRRSISSIVTAIKKQIDQNPMNGISTAALAGHAGISRNVLQELFKAKYGTSIGQYKLQVRMAEAKHQLKSGKSIKVVSIMLHYASPSSFSNAFSNFYQLSPTEWLQQIRHHNANKQGKV
jgi:AraC-like DNA-binding protein